MTKVDITRGGEDLLQEKRLVKRWLVQTFFLACFIAFILILDEYPEGDF